MSPEDKIYDIIVIGAGIGGLVCANFLAKSGMRVLIVERQNRAGGYCVSFQRQGYNFDVCRHLGGFGPNSIMRFICSELGVYDKLKLWRSDPSDIIMVGDKTISVFNDISKTEDSFKKAFPDETDNIDRFFDLISNLDIFDTVKRYAKQTFRDVLDKFFIDENLKGALCPLLGNAGLGPSQLSAVKGLLLYSQFILDGGYYTEGGIGNFSEALLEGLKDKGGSVLFGTTVKSIIVKDKKAAGVILGDGKKLASDYVIAACDATETFMDLIGPEHLSNNFVRHLKSLTPSMSVFMVFLGLKDIKRHGLMDKTTLWYIHKSYSAVDKFDDIYKDIYAGKVDMDKDHVVITAALDEQTITMYVGVPYKDERYWQRQKNSFCENIIKRAERLIPGIMANIAVKETATPSTFYKYTLNHKGAMYGWASSPGQIGADIMPVATPIQKLFLCSHWSTTGLGQGGIMSVAYTAMKTSEYLLSQKQEGRSYVSF